MQPTEITTEMVMNITGWEIFCMALAAGAGFACGFVPLKMLLEWGLTPPHKFVIWNWLRTRAFRRPG